MWFVFCCAERSLVDFDSCTNFFFFSGRVWEPTCLRLKNSTSIAIMIDKTAQKLSGLSSRPRLVSNPDLSLDSSAIPTKSINILASGRERFHPPRKPWHGKRHIEEKNCLRGKNKNEIETKCQLERWWGEAAGNERNNEHLLKKNVRKKMLQNDSVNWITSAWKHCIDSGVEREHENDWSQRPKAEKPKRKVKRHLKN